MIETTRNAHPENIADCLRLVGKSDPATLTADDWTVWQQEQIRKMDAADRAEINAAGGYHEYMERFATDGGGEDLE